MQIIDVAYAQPQGQPPGGGAVAFISSLVPFILVILIFYFLVIMPQHRKQKKHRQMLDAMKKGDKVVTSAGIFGTVMNITDRKVTLQIADNVRIKILKDSISEVITKEEEEPA